MCGRFALVATAQQIAEEFGVSLAEGKIGPGGIELAPRYNIAPSQPVLAVRENAVGERELTHFAWGLVPSWAPDPSWGARMINVRAETSAEKPAFRNALRRRRCIIPASGFYEWEKAKGVKQPWFFRGRDGRLLGLAGIWEVWNGPQGEYIETCAILTVPAVAPVARLHDRMPAILSREAYGPWLDRHLEKPEKIKEILEQTEANVLECYRVSPIVNSPTHDVPECIAPLEG